LLLILQYLKAQELKYVLTTGSALCLQFAYLDISNANPFSDMAPNLNFLALSEVQINIIILITDVLCSLAFSSVNNSFYMISL
jgi:hypothetical protein